VREAYGSDAFRELTTRSRGSDTYEETRALVSDVYDTALAAIVEEYEETYPVCDKTYYRDDSFECGRNLAAVPTERGERLSLDFSLACDDPLVIGPRFGERWTTVTLEVRQAAEYMVSIGPEDTELLRPGQVRVRRCGSTCFDEAPEISTAGLLVGGDRFCLEVGRYTVRMSLRDDEAADYLLRITNDGPTAACQ
jgi:hypothetical protein